MLNANKRIRLNDNFDKINGHVIPSMISKFIEAKIKSKSLKLLGTETLREFIHTDDLSNAIYTSLEISSPKLRKNLEKLANNECRNRV